MISQSKYVGILMDANHIMRGFLSLKEKALLDRAVKEITT